MHRHQYHYYCWGENVLGLDDRDIMATAIMNMTILMIAMIGL